MILSTDLFGPGQITSKESGAGKPLTRTSTNDSATNDMSSTTATLQPSSTYHTTSCERVHSCSAGKGGGLLSRAMRLVLRSGTLFGVGYGLSMVYTRHIKDRVQINAQIMGVRVGDGGGRGEPESHLVPNLPNPEGDGAEVLGSPERDLTTAIRNVTRQVDAYLALLDSGMSEDEQIENRVECVTKLRTIWQGVREDFPPDVQVVVHGYMKHALRGRTFGLLLEFD